MDEKPVDPPADPSGDEPMATPAPEAAAAEAPVGPSIKVKVKFSGGTKFEIDVDAGKSLAVMKEQCSEQCKVASNQLRIFLKGKQLKDESITVQQANVQNGGQIFLVKGAVQGGETAAAAPA